MYDFGRQAKKKEVRRFDLAHTSMSRHQGSQHRNNDSVITNPQDPFATPTKMICEPEITYLISMMKLEDDKWKK